MHILYSDNFKKKYKKLSLENKNKVDLCVKKFINNPFDQSIRNHALQGSLQGYRSIKAGYDLRLVFEERGGYIIVIFLNVGNHDGVCFNLIV